VIPRRLLQTWKSKTVIPADLAYWRETVVRMNPAFEPLLFDDQDNRDLVSTHCPRLLSMFDSFPEEIYRADAVRPIYLFFLGGFYVDMDVECLRPFDRYAERGGILLGRMGNDPDFPESIPNALMASEAREGFWLLYLAQIVAASSQRVGQRPEAVTGPVVLKECVDLYVSEPIEARARVDRFLGEYLPTIDADTVRYSPLTLLPGVEWFPLDWHDKIHRQFRLRLMRRRKILSEAEARRFFPKSSAVTYWAHSWGSRETFLGAISRVLGGKKK
jgi:inositol phosphorylceramide mannosyltransferase catalytic subunit